MRRLFLVLALALPMLASIPLPPAPTRYVTDAAGVIPDDRERALEEKLAAFDRATTNQVLVYAGRRVPPGTTIDEMGAEAIRTWKVGQAKKDNGAILFVFVDDRASRLEVGYGLEGTLTDARSKRILMSMREALRAGDYAAAVEAGSQQVLATVSDPVAADAAQLTSLATAPPPNRVAIVIAAIFVLVAMIVVFLVIRAVRSRPMSAAGFSSVTDDGWSGSSASDSSSSSSSTFRGGGGSGGGGGATDKW